MRRKKGFGGLAVVVAVLALMVYLAGTGCSPSATPAGGQEGQEGKGEKTALIQVRGSDSEVNLVQKLAEEFMSGKTGVQIAVTGGGSGVGIAALIDGIVDIAMSSRPMKEEEIGQAKANGIEPVPVRFAVDGLAVIVSEANPISKLTLEQLGAIYRGEINSWDQVGGEDKKINLYGRQSNSGTYVFFMESVLKGDYSPEMRNMGGNADIVEAVTGDLTGIGYVAIGYALEGDTVRKGIKVLEIAIDTGSQAVSPLDVGNITSGAYPITRPLYMYTAGQPEGAIKDFIMFILSEKGQQIVREQGFYPLRAEDVEANQKSLNF